MLTRFGLAKRLEGKKIVFLHWRKIRLFPKGLAHDFDQKLEISSQLQSEPGADYRLLSEPTIFTPFHGICSDFLAESLVIRKLYMGIKTYLFKNFSQKKGSRKF